MFGITDLWLFIIAGIILNMMPGPDSLYIVGRSVSQGFKAGSVAALGIGAGTLIHVFAAAFGLSAILATSATAFTIVKIIGCVYLIYIGFSMLMSTSKPAAQSVQTVTPVPLFKIFYQGFLTNVLNPKVALFFLAFVPQFISAESTDKALAFIFLGIIFNINGMIWCHFLAWSSASISKRVKKSERMNLWLNRIAGMLFGYFGVKLAFSELH